jgi:hypothetical protein
MLKSLLILSSIIIYTSKAFAAPSDWITLNGSAKITGIQIEGGVVVVDFSATDKSLVDGCAVQGKAVLIDDSKTGDRQYAALMAAYMAGKSVIMFGSGCWGGWNTTFPKIYMVKPQGQ